MNPAEISRLTERLAGYSRRVEAAIDRAIVAPTDARARLYDAMRYAVLNGGKRVRASLVYATGAALGAPESRLDAPAVSMEMVHAYSLVHDDLPAMDDDDLRRGQPTCHRAYDEATALLAGDALQTKAFEVLCASGPAPAGDSLPLEIQIELVRTLAAAIGADGMAGGQAIDLGAVGQQLALDELERMHRFKTGALIRAAVRMGAICAPDVDDELMDRLDRYAGCIGLAFQIRDDILDVVGDAATTGKTQGADIARNKPTYPALMGLAHAERKARDLHSEACENIASLGCKADTLRSLSEFIVHRAH